MRGAAAEEDVLAVGPGLQPAHGAWLEPVLQHLNAAGAGRSSQGRLLALLVLLHPSGFRGIRMAAEDFAARHAGLTEAALQDPAETGSLRRAADRPVSCAVSAEAAWTMADAGHRHAGVPLLPVHEHLAMHGWVCRLVGHALLRGQPAEVRLAAVCLTARAAPCGRGDVGLRRLSRMCAPPPRLPSPR
ncbi:hypothetical protein ABZ725_50050 [Streptomyces sp. NPDC006872]|uniref:hypothetical protein n=1 Tax=Streptomyces sp. NPDC006872 TaxID=3155720 RepID=UPI0033E51326